MLNEKIERSLNAQIKMEAQSSQFYLAMASWAETEGLMGTAKFLYTHSDEEREHMLKLVKFVNERGGLPAQRKLCGCDAECYLSLLGKLAGKIRLRD